jgi:hypothetical protein
MVEKKCKTVSKAILEVMICAFVIALTCAAKRPIETIGKELTLISEVEAKKSVCRFLVDIGRDGGFSIERMEELLAVTDSSVSPNAGVVYTFSSPFGRLRVARGSGYVISFFPPDISVESDRAISAKDAKAIAIRLLRKVYCGFDETIFSLNSTEEDECCFEFSFRQIRREAEISIFHNFIRIAIRKDSGDLAAYSCSHLTLVRTAPPGVSEAGACSIVRKTVGASYRIESVELVEFPTNGATSSVTVWAVDVALEGSKFPQGKTILVNADTGEIVDAFK